MTDFEVNRAMILIGVVLLPVTAWFLKFNVNFRTRIMGLFFIVLFSKGIFELIGIPNAISGLFCELLLVIMLISFRKSGKRYFPGLFLLLGLVFAALISTLINGTSAIQFLLFFREYFESVIFFFLIINIRFSEKETQFLMRLLIWLFVSQIAANIIKLLILQDIVEPYIGTIAVLGGSKTTILALLGGSYCIVQYLITTKRIYLLGLLGFVVFSLLGGKRATILYFPILYLISYLIFQLKYSGKKGILIKKLVTITAGIVLLFYTSARLLPTLNPENKIGGSFDLAYIVEYSKSYATADYINEIGRSEAPAYLFLKSIRDGVDKTALGYGTGHLIKSSFNKETAELTSDEITSLKYGVGYGARTGFLQFFLQVGLIGVILISLFFLNLLRIVWRMKSAPVVLRFTSILLVLVIFLDYFTYSYESILFSAIGCSLFFFLGLTLQPRSK